jgi:NDP-sugar pyrophosphorylase family protein
MSLPENNNYARTPNGIAGGNTNKNVPCINANMNYLSSRLDNSTGFSFNDTLGDFITRHDVELVTLTNDINKFRSIEVTNGDVLTNINYGGLLDFHVNSNAEATMAIRSYEWQNPFGVVETDGLRITNYEEKPTSLCYINAGVYVLQPSAIKLINEFKNIDMPSLFQQLLIENKKVIAFPIHENWEDIGRPRDLEKANFDFNNRSN